MKFTVEHIAELNLLLQFDSASLQTGIKVHTDAAPELQAAAKVYSIKSLYPTGWGYLTNEGIQLAERAHKLLNVLSSKA